ncbi:hypothetical protein AAG570_003661 [Ranatra chinensis]|uniref:Carboxylic ester hydrolase n=1 Tax=Ranatra chinensis TaxID=642074 RepID=A0ABD0Y4X7_9HEMI
MKSSWSEETPGGMHTKSFGPACPQPIHELEPTYGAKDITQNEDCLYLNVWTTDMAVRYKKIPVVLLLEGEGFVTGYPGRLPCQDLAAEGVVVVSAAYRLNVFGFLCLEDAEGRGNVGLLDQYLVLVWIRQNIEAFGGDPHQVTIMGHSAGAVSALYHMISPRTKGLFQRVILMSGSIRSPWWRESGGTKSNASLAIARSLGCLGVTTSSAILACLRSKSYEEVLKAFETQYMNGNWTELPLPVVDDFLPEIEQYLPTSPDEALSKGQYLMIPVITGITSREGAIAISQWTDLIQQGYSQLRRFFMDAVIPSMLDRYNMSRNSPELREILAWQYVNPVQDSDTALLAAKLLDFYSDAQYVGPHLLQLEHLLNKSRGDKVLPVYNYYFDQQSPDNLYKNSLNITGSSHGTELVYLLGPSLGQRLGGSAARFTPQQMKLSNTVKRLWTEFIRKGEISASPYGYGVSWTPCTGSADDWLVLKSDDSLPPSQQVMRRASSSGGGVGAQIWTHLLPRLQQIIANRTAQLADREYQPAGMQLTKGSFFF